MHAVRQAVVRLLLSQGPRPNRRWVSHTLTEGAWFAVFASHHVSLLHRHFSPIGGYHAGEDMVLILDVARFKYPPHWVKTETLFKAMLRHDSVTNMYCSAPTTCIVHLASMCQGSWTMVAGHVASRCYHNPSLHRCCCSSCCHPAHPVANLSARVSRTCYEPLWTGRELVVTSC